MPPKPNGNAGMHLFIPRCVAIGANGQYRQKYEAQLMNLRHGDNWDLMCSTTPATIRGMHFDSPQVCEVTVSRWRIPTQPMFQRADGPVQKWGRMGIWDVPDGAC